MAHTDANLKDEARGRLHSPAASKKIRRFQEIMQSSADAHQKGDHKTASRGYRRALKIQPDNVDALQLLGVASHQSGDSKNALRLLQKALEIDPANVRCHNNIGSVFNEIGNYDAAEHHFREALKGDDAPAEAWYNLGLAQRRRGELDEALESFAKAFEMEPDYLAPLKATGAIYIERHDFEESERIFRKCLALDPNDMEVGNNLGYAVQMQGRLDEAEALFKQTLERLGQAPAIGYNMRVLLTAQGRSEEARELFRQQLREKPETWISELGLALGIAMRGSLSEALRSIEDILEAFPDDAKVWNDVGKVLMAMEKTDKAIEVLRRAVEIDPTMASAFNNLGSACSHIHAYKAAVHFLKKAVSLSPDFLEPHLNLCRALRGAAEFDQANLFGRATMQLGSYERRYFTCLLQVFRGTCDYEALEELGSPWENAAVVPKRELPANFLDFLVFSETADDHRQFFDLVRSWAAYVEREAAHSPLPVRERTRSRDKLRIGFLSSDLRQHSVSRFLIPLMRNYDRERFEFYCYPTIRVAGDPIQVLFEQEVDKFTFVRGKTDREIARTIQEDEIDILLELNGFTDGSKLEAMAYKPAPVQMSWLGYPFTCGLKAIDHILLNQYLDGPEGRQYLVEEPVNMPESWVCFGKFADIPVTPGLPMDRNGVFTFGTLNNVYKYTPSMIANWAEVLKRVPGSRFLVVRPEVDSFTICKNITEQFQKNGVDPDRLYFFNNRNEKKSHLHYYNEIDLSLDTFPLTGGTTTCEAVWMGVPVVTLVGELFHQRLSYSVLMQCGLEDFCTFDKETFVERAVEFANDPDRLRAIRHNLREVVKASPLCDEDRFVYQFQEMLEAVAEYHDLR